MPNRSERRSRRIEWFIVSKAAISEEVLVMWIVDDFDDMIMSEEKSRFNRMMFDIGRLERIGEVFGIDLNK